MPTIINSYYQFLKESGNSERYVRDCLKCMISYSIFLNDKHIDEVKSKETVMKYLKSKEKIIEEDPDRKSITTWNDYLGRIKKFYRWLHNQYRKKKLVNVSDWITPDFVKIKTKTTKRLSPYLESELWDREERVSNKIRTIQAEKGGDCVDVGPRRQKSRSHYAKN